MGAEKIYGSAKVPPTASKEEKQKFVIDKYDKRVLLSQYPSSLPQLKCQSEAPSKTKEHQHVSDAPIVRRATESHQQCGQGCPCEPQAKTSSTAQAVTIRDAFFDDFFNELEDSKFQSKSCMNLIDMKPAEQGGDLDGY